MLDDASCLTEDETRDWAFLNNRPSAVAFTDLMTAALEALMVQRELRHLAHPPVFTGR